MATYVESPAGGQAYPAPLSADDLPLEWRIWIADNRLAGTPDEQIYAAAAESGYDPESIAANLEALPNDAYYALAQRSTGRWRKLKSILAVRKALASLSHGNGQIERRSCVSRAEFLERYYAANSPVILTGMLATSFAYQYWTPEHLSQTCGDVTIEVMAGRKTDPRYEMNCDAHRFTVRLADYVARVLEGGSTNDYYLVANNGFFTRDETQVLLSEAPQLPEYLDHSESQQKTFLWFGPAGTITPLHHDIMNVMVAQIYGRKRFTLLCPEDTPHVYNEIGVYGEVDCKNPDYVRHPWYRYASPIEVVLEPGELLFIPVGWWHHVEGLDTSIMVSYINFCFPNDFPWENP